MKRGLCFRSLLRIPPGMSVGRQMISGMTRYVIRGPLTYELALKDSPVRQFLDAS
jgi:hypothetical protein